VTASRHPPEVVRAAAPPRVAAWLERAPDGPCQVLHACRDILWLDVRGRAVGVSAVGAPKLPNALRTDVRTNLAGLLAETLLPGVRTAYLDSGILYLGGRALVTCRLVDVRAPRFDAGWIPRTSPASAQRTPRPRGAGLVALPARVDAGVVPDLVGRGDGLTPYGDDVLCGWLAVHRAAGLATPEVDEAVRASLHRTTTLSATLLECALAGEAADLLAHHLRALGSPTEARTRAALEALGHSSGHGLSLGVDLAVATLHEVLAA
jgi:Protein of unknown function (DUF2877)